MDEGEGRLQQDTGNDNPDEVLPTYNYLEAQERDNPNSRFGRWRSWVEKRAAERYADVSEDDLRRQRQRGWGTALDTSFSKQAPPFGSVMSPMSSQVVSERLGETRLSVYHFGSRFIPHSSSPIRSLVPLNEDRYLLLGGMDGLGLLDIFPDNVNLSVQDASMLHALESAARKDLWTGEAIYQMAILESYMDSSGNIQGVLLALVGSEDAENDREPSSKSVRMYNLASIWSLVKWVSSHPDAKPLEIQAPKGWTHQQSTSRRLHRPNTHTLTKSLKTMTIDQNGRPTTPTGSIASVTAASFASERSSPPKHQDSQDTADSWDMVDDLPLRWASDYVNLASAGSKLAMSHVLFFELWKNEGVARATSMLAIATKGCILLYETPKGERSFRFIKEFFTPLPAKSVNFVQTTSIEKVKATPIYPEGERIRKERPLSKLGHDSPVIKSPRARRLSTPGDHTYGSQLSLFVVFEKRACLIRIADSSVGEIELWDDGGGPPSPTATASLPSAMSPSRDSSHGRGFRRSIQSLDAFGFAREGKGPWLPMLTLEIPSPPPTNGEVATSKTVLIMSRGRRTHILASPLPIPLSSQPPLRVIRWHSQPRQVAARLSTGPDKEPKLQVLGFTDQGVEIVETSIGFIFKPPDLGLTIGKGKGKVRSISIPSEPLVRATWESPDITGYLGRGGYWHTLDTTSGRPEFRNIISDSDLSVYARAGSRTELGQGIYAWTQKGLEDYRVVWLGDGPPVST